MKGAKTNKGQRGTQRAGNTTQQALKPLPDPEDSEEEEKGDKTVLAEKTPRITSRIKVCHQRPAGIQTWDAKDL